MVYLLSVRISYGSDLHLKQICAFLKILKTKIEIVRGRRFLGFGFIETKDDTINYFRGFEIIALLIPNFMQNYPALINRLLYFEILLTPSLVLACMYSGL